MRGRLLTDGDTHDAPGAVVINEAMVRRYWPNGEEPIGKRLRIDEGRTVEHDRRHRRRRAHASALDQPARAEMYLPYAQMRRSASQAIVLRTSGDPAAMASAARGVLAELDPAQPIYDVDRSPSSCPRRWRSAASR